MVRGGDGGRWSDVATPAGPGVAVQSSPVLAPPAPRPAPTPFPLPETAANRTPWIVGISLLVLVAVVGAALFLGRSSDSPPAAGPAVPTQPQALVDPTFPPGTVRIFDQAAGISY